MISVTPNLVNNQSFVEQKINLDMSWNDKLLAIPTFVLLVSPITSAEGEQYYSLIMYLSHFYKRSETDKEKKHSMWWIEDLTFQYDLNYSKIEKSRGQLKLSSSIQLGFGSGWEMTDIIYNLDQKVIDRQIDSSNYGKKIEKINYYQYKIHLPVNAIKKDEINSLKYSFTSQNNGHFAKDRTALINSDTNFGSFNFRINSQPEFVINLNTEFFNQDFYKISIKNPVAFDTFFWTSTKNTNKQKPMNKIIGQPLVTEHFTIQFNNLHTNDLKPLTIKHDFKLNKNHLKKQYINDMTRYFEKLKIFIHHFDLSQNVLFKVYENNEKKQSHEINGQINQIKLQTYMQNETVNNETLDYELKIISPFISKIAENNNCFYPPLNQSFAELITFTFNFKTWFKYQFNFNLSQISQNPLIGSINSKIRHEKQTENDLNFIKWWKIRKVTLNSEQIRKFYSQQTFKFSDYQSLLVIEETNEVF